MNHGIGLGRSQISVIRVSWSRRYCVEVRGTIVIDNDAGRALCRKPAAVRAADVLYCSGEFCAGDAIYIAFRTSDGSQYVVASGIARCDETELRLTPGVQRHEAAATARTDDPDIVVLEQDVQLLWPPNVDAGKRKIELTSKS
jgi:glutamate 5-kinase